MYSNHSKLIQGKPKHCYLNIAIPTYNKPDMLKRGIESVIHQDSFCLCQLLVVDNDSREGETPTSLMMKDYIDNDNILYYRNSTNVGMYGNWNKCYELSDSDYVLLLHNDDFLLKGCIDYVITTLKRNTYPALYLNRSCNYPYKEVPAKNNWGRKRKLINTICGKKIIEHKVKIKDTLFGFCLTAPTGFIMSKQLFYNGYSFRLESPKWPSDAELQLKLAENNLLYMSEEKMVVKYEDCTNEGNNKSTTIPLIETHKRLYFDVYKNSNFFFKKLLIYVRLRLIAQNYKVNNEEKVRSIIPSFYFSYTALFIYKILMKINSFGFILR